jgi:hypothetical protein
MVASALMSVLHQNRRLHGVQICLATTGGSGSQGHPLHAIAPHLRMM